MIVFSGLRRIVRIMAAYAPPCCDPTDVCREAVDHCTEFGVGIDLSFRDDIIEARPGDDPIQLAAAFEHRARERAKPVARGR
jgi:hypothetical protein